MTVWDEKIEQNLIEGEGADLLAFTEGCRLDMHEPDEQGIIATVIGTKLDNAMGTSIREDALTRGYQEMVLVLSKEGRQLRVNLADLIALARIGAKRRSLP